MNKHIFVINGTGGCGKNSFVSAINKIESTYEISSVDIVKKMAREIGWNGSKEEKDRKFLSDLKDLCTEYNDSPFKYISERIDVFNNEESYVANGFMFIHIREPEEIERVVKEFGAKTILVKRNSVKDIKSNSADANVYDYNYDYIIENNGTLEDLDESAKKFIEDVEKEEKKYEI